MTPCVQWASVCEVDDILPDTGVCALIGTRQIAVFRLGTSEFYAIDNVDPKSGASVLSRGLVGNLGEHLVVASPIYKNHFNLRTGTCLESPEHSVRTHPVRIEDGKVFIALS